MARDLTGMGLGYPGLGHSVDLSVVCGLHDDVRHNFVFGASFFFFNFYILLLFFFFFTFSKYEYTLAYFK